MPDFAGFKTSFFDVKAISDRIDPAVKKALSRFGAYVRQRARTSIRTRKAVSPPGSPPSSHVGTLKRLILFGYDPQAKSVVIGPTVGGSASGAPELLEYGGESIRREKTKSRLLHVRPRPFMTPAFEAELPRVAEGLKNLIK